MAPGILRKKYIIDKTQYKILAIIIIYIFIALFISGVMMFLPSILEMISDGETGQQHTTSELLLLHRKFWPLFLLVIIIIAIHSILLFHRIFGSLYNFRLIFRQVTGGDLTVIPRTRKHDLLRTDEIVIREMITSLKTNVATAKLSHTSLDADIDKLEQELLGMDLSLEEIREKLQEIQQKSKEVQKCLAHFTT